MLELFDQTQNHHESHEIKNRDRNKLFHDDRQVHDWYRFVLSFPPQLVRDYLRRFALKNNEIVLDPFCGTGTTLIEAKFAGYRGIGLEANRFAHLASEVKLNWDIDPIELLEAAKVVKDAANRKLSAIGISDYGHGSEVKADQLIGFDAEKAALVLKGSISELPLHKCLILLNELREFRESTFYKPLSLALANIAVFKSSNLRFGPEVGVGKIKRDAPVVNPWFDQVSRMSRDLISVQGHKFPSAYAILGDSRQINGRLLEQSVSAVITSPPYPNEKDYTRTTRLESVLLGLVSSKEDLRAVKHDLLRSNTRGVYKGDDDDAYVQDVPEVQRIAEEIENRRIVLQKTSGFERMYSRVTKLYFGGMAKHLKELQPYLKKGAQLAYVVGDQASYLRVMIRTGHILGEIAASLGYVDVQIIPFRTRFSTATKSELNEEVVTFRWQGLK